MERAHRKSWRICGCSILTFAAVAGFSPVLLAQSRSNFPEAPYYADLNRLTTGANAALDLLQANLSALYPAATLAVPAPAGAHTATDAQVSAALAKTTTDLLSGAATGTTVESVFGAIIKARPTQAVALATAAATAIAVSPAAATPAASTLLTNITALTIDARPAENAIPAAAAIVGVVAANYAALNGATAAADATGAAVSRAADLADKITAAAIQAARAAGVESQTLGIVTAATTAAASHGAQSLIAQIAFSAVRNGKSGTVLEKPILQAVFSGLHTVGADTRAGVLTATLGAVSALAADSTAQNNLKSAVSESYSTYSAAANAAIDTYAFIISDYATKKAALRRTPTTAEAGALAAMRLATQLGSSPNGNADVITAAALVARPANVTELVRKAILVQPAAALDIVEEGVRASSSAANLIVTAAIVQVGVDATGTKQADLVARALRGAPASQASAITIAGLQATGLAGSLTDVKLARIVTAAATEAASNGASIGDLTGAVAKTFKAVTVGSVRGADSSAAIIKAVVAGLSSANLDGLAQAMAGIINAAAAPSRTLTQSQADLNTSQLLAAAQSALVSSSAAATAQLSLAASTAHDVLQDKVNFFGITKSKLATATSPAQVTAIVYAAGLSNPAGISAIATIAAVQNPGARTAIQAAAASVNPATARNVQAAIDTAVHVAASGGPDLFDYIGSTVLSNNALTGDVVIGAVIARPDYANIIAKAAAFRAPQLSAGKVVPALFAFGDLTRIKAGSENDPTARVAAIMAGIASGLLDAKLDVASVPEKILGANGQLIYNPRYQTVQTTLLKENVTAVVKAALSFQASVDYSVASTVTLSPSGTLVSNNTTPGQTSRSVGPAAAVTGVVSQTTIYGEADINAVTVGAIVKAAAAAAGKEHWVTIAQAAAQAFVTVSGANAATFTGVATSATQTNGANIVSAILGILSTSASDYSAWRTALQNAVSFGAQQSANHAANPLVTAYRGIGAKGVVDYAHQSGTGPYVTNIFDL